MGTAGLTQQDAAAAGLLTPTSGNEIKYGWVETLLEYGNYVYVSTHLLHFYFYYFYYIRLTSMLFRITFVPDGVVH